MDAPLQTTSTSLTPSTLINATAPVKLYYVHYIDYNKRLDEWVTIERMKIEKIQAPPTSASAAAAAAAAAANAAAAAALQLQQQQQQSGESKGAHMSNKQQHELSTTQDLTATGKDSTLTPNTKRKRKNRVSPQPTSNAAAASLQTCASPSSANTNRLG